MARRESTFSYPLNPYEIARQHVDAENALRLYYQYSGTGMSARFVGYSREDLAVELQDRIDELDLSSSLVLLTACEAMFRVDFHRRCELKHRSDISRAFREIGRNQGQWRLSLERDILSLWREYHPEHKDVIGDLIGALNYRHWLAHGRYWKPKLARVRYDFDTLFAIAHRIASEMPLLEFPWRLSSEA